MSMKLENIGRKIIGIGEVTILPGEEALARLANELGINYAKCKDQADVLKKVRAALEK